MLKKILIACAAWVALVLAVGFVLPSKYRVERSTTIHAPAEAVYAQVAHLERWQDWAPWNAKKYPGNQWMFGGPAMGVGAVRSWRGEDVGTGTLSLTEADPKTGVAYDMSLEDGRYLLHGRISFSPEGEGTRVTWVDEGDLGGGPLLHYLRFPLQSRLGGQLEAALAQLKKRVEAGPLPVDTKPEPTPAPVQATAPPREPTPAPAPPAEGSPPSVPPSTEGSQAASPGEVAPTTGTPAPTGEPAQATPGTSAPTAEPAPGEAPPVPPASEPAPAPTSAPADAQAAPTTP